MSIYVDKERFPNSFMFKLTNEEFEELVTVCDRLLPLKHSTVLPFAFTEQGVSMLSAVLRSPTAVQVSIKIMESFVKMRQYFMMNSHLFNRINLLEIRMSDTEAQIADVIKAISSFNDHPNQGIFFDGQMFDAYTFISDLVRKALRRIILIDNYVDDTVLKILDKRSADMAATIYTPKMSEQLRMDITKHNSQYPPIEVKTFSKAHDRFLIIDDEVYLIGASIKDLGKKWFGFTLMEKAEELLVRILQPSIIKGYFVDFEHNEWLLAYVPPDLAGEKQKPEVRPRAFAVFL